MDQRKNIIPIRNQDHRQFNMYIGSKKEEMSIEFELKKTTAHNIVHIDKYRKKK